jgi:hypothetical protein
VGATVRPGALVVKASNSAAGTGAIGAFEEVVSRYVTMGIEQFIIGQPRAEEFSALERVAADVLTQAALDSREWWE